MCLRAAKTTQFQEAHVEIKEIRIKSMLDLADYHDAALCLEYTQ